MKTILPLFLLLMLIPLSSAVSVERERAIAYAEYRGWDLPTTSRGWKTLEFKALITECPWNSPRDGKYYSGLFRQDSDGVFKCLAVNPKDSAVSRMWPKPVYEGGKCFLKVSPYSFKKSLVVHYVRICNGKFTAH